MERDSVTKGQGTLNSFIMGSSNDPKNTRDVCCRSEVECRTVCLGLIIAIT